MIADVQPVYIRGDFVNCYVELTGDQVKALVEYAKKMADENETT